MPTDDSAVSLLVRAETQLLHCAPTAVIVPAAVLAEAAVKALLGDPDANRLELGHLIRLAHERAVLERDWLTDLNWLNRHRIRCVHSPPAPPGPSVDDAARAIEFATRLARRAGLLQDEHIPQARRAAQQAVCGAAPSECMKLDRRRQRSSFEDLLHPPPRVLVFLAHGEFDQGQTHFSRYAALKLRNTLGGRWTDVALDWPGPRAAAGQRLAELTERLQLELGVACDLPKTDPLGDEDAWDQGFDELAGLVMGARRSLFVRHRIRRPVAADRKLIESYLSRLWRRVAASDRPGCVALAFETSRAEQTGFPWLSRSWRLGRRERLATRRLVRSLDDLRLGPEVTCASLDELDCLSIDDVSDWLRRVRRMDRESAAAESRDLIATTRGGRFELVLQRISRDPRS